MSATPDAPGTTETTNPEHRRYAERMLAEVTGALLARDQYRFRTVCGQVHASSLDPRAVDAAVLGALQQAVQHSWDRHWQPGELDHVLRRASARAGASVWYARLLTDAMAGRMRAHPDATVDERWRAQLTALDAAVWWTDDGDCLSLFGQRHRLARRAVLAGAFELMRWMYHDLPPLESAGHAPGTPIPPRRTGRLAKDADRRMLDRIRALLAKAESTGFPEEAEAFTAKAQQLMARHSIDHALLDAAAGAAAGPATRRLVIDNPYESPKAMLLQVVAQANHCRAVRFKEFGLSTLVGFDPDLDAVELLYTSLLVQAVRAMTAANTRPDRYGRNDVRSFRQSFLSAYAHRIGERLTEANRVVHTELAVGTDLVPVMAARTEAVTAAFDALFPERVSRTSTVSNAAGWMSGRAAADRAELAVRAPLPRSA